MQALKQMHRMYICTYDFIAQCSVMSFELVMLIPFAPDIIPYPPTNEEKRRPDRPLFIPRVRGDAEKQFAAIYFFFQKSPLTL